MSILEFVKLFGFDKSNLT